MTTSEILLQAKNLHIELLPDRDQLRFKCPKGALTAELRAAIIECKAELIKLLTNPLPRQPTVVEAGVDTTAAYELVVTHDRVAAVCAELDRHDTIGLDTETYVAGDNSDGKAALDPKRNKVRLVQVSTASGVYIFDVLKLVEMPLPVRQILEGKQTKTGHTLKFDAKCLMHHFGVELSCPDDIYVGSVLADGYVDHDKKGAHTLQTLARRHLGIDLDKSTATSDWGVAELSRTQLEYAARDATVALRLSEKIHKKAVSAGVERAWAIENNVITPFSAMELSGICLNHNEVSSLERERHDEAAAARQIVVAALGEDVNLNSPSQLLAAFTRLEINLAATNKHVLAEYIADERTAGRTPHDVIEALVTLRRSHTAAETFAAWLAAIGVDGRVHPSFRSLGARTGRTSCSSPNIQNVSRDGRVRGCFVAAPGHVFIIADYSAIELRVIAELIKEPELRRCFLSGICPHRRTAAFILKKNIADVTKEERQKAKAANFGLSFGQGVAGFMEFARNTYGVIYIPTEAAATRTGFLQLYKQIASWHRISKATGPLKLEARTASGRLRRFPNFSFTEYLNTPIQGTAADGAKVALALLHDALKPFGARVVNFIHDEVIVECRSDLAPEAALVVKKCLIEGMATFITTIPVEVAVEIAPHWLKP